MNKKKIIVTGASGFLGNNLINTLIGKDEYSVYAYSSRYGQEDQPWQERNIRFLHKDAIFSSNNGQILKNAIVVNCAFPRNSSGIGLADGIRYIQRVFVESEKCGAKAIINISSQSVYSQTRETIATEYMPVSLETPYAVGKYATELILESICKKAQMAYTNLRIASLIGPEFDQRIVNRLVKQALSSETLCVVKSARKFGFLDIEDAVRALLALLETNTKQWRTVYTVGNGKAYDIEYIAQRIKYVFKKNGLSIPRINIENGNGFGSTGVSYSEFHKDTGFEPSTDLDTSIQHILTQLQKNNNLDKDRRK